MPPQYDSIYLSPHLDDAALSCGGQIYEQTQAGKSVLVITVMAGDPPSSSLSAFARSQHDKWQVEGDAMAVRRAEDAAACAVLSADYRHWDVADCIYRRHPATGRPLYRSEQAIFGVPSAADNTLGALTALMDTLPPFGRLLVPLTVGSHVDHQLVRWAAERVFGAADCAYYEDYPYVESNQALKSILGEESSWRSELIPLSPLALEARIRAIACYKSQLMTLFGGRKAMRQQVCGFVRSVAGERVWCRR